MPLYYKNQGTWETVDSPYIKQNGEWIEPEQAYIKEDGEWKLVFEQFSFDVTTKSPGQTTRNLVLKGQLNDFEGFVGKRSEFFKTVFFKETNLTNSTTGDAVAIDKSRGLVATGGANDTVYIYNQNLSVINGSNVSETKNFESPQVVPEPDNQINSLSFYESGEALAVAADKLYIFEDGFGEAVSFEIDPADGTLFTDLDFYEDSGILVAGTESAAVYVFSKNEDGNWQRDNKIDDPISDRITSVAFSQPSGNLAIGNDRGQVYVYKGTTNGDHNDTIESFNQATSVAFSREDEKLAVADFDGKVAIYSNGLVEEDSFNNTGETSSGSEGGVAWDDSGLLAHASADSNVYIYEQRGSTYENVKTFEEAEKPYQTVVWDGTNEIIVGGTNEEQSGTFHVFSTGVQMSFRWGENGTGFPYTRRVTGFASSGKIFESGVIGLEPDTQYEFQAQGKAANGRLSNGETETVSTPNIVVETADPEETDVNTFSATIGGSLDTNNGADISGSYIGAIQYKKATRTTWNNEKEAGIITPNSSFTVVIDGLEAQQEYDVRAKATYEGTVAFGGSEKITTEKVRAAFDQNNLQFGDAFTSSPTGPDQKTLEATLQETSGGGQYQVNNVKIQGVNSTSFSVDKSIEGKAVPQDPEASPRTRSFDVTFDPSFRLDKKADVVVEHTAPYGENPLTLPIRGTGEEPTTIEAEGVSFTTTNDQNEEINEVTIVETGKDYGATINNVSEDSEQPEAVSSEWDLKEDSFKKLPDGDDFNLPGNLPAGKAFKFEIGWNATDGNDTQIFYVQIDYEADGGRSGSQQLRVPVEGNADGTVDVNLDPERNGEIIDETSETYDFGSEITKRTNRDPNPSVTDEDVTVVRSFQLVGDPASAGTNGSPYKVQHMEIVGDDPGDFAILNAPSAITDESSGTSVEIAEGDTVPFEVEFNPSSYQNNPIEAQLAIYADGAANSVEFENDTPYLLQLQGEGLQPGEIATENANDPSADEPYQVGTSIAGGNPLPDEGTLPITVTNISPDRDVLIRSDSIENAYNNDFRVESSIDGDLIGQSPETIGESTDAEVEIRPTVKRSNNQKYADGGVIGRANYKIFNDADFGPDPVNVEIQGTFQVTDVIFLDGNRTDGTEFDPETSDFEIVAGPGTVSTKTLTVQIDKGDNSVSTNAVINDPQKNPISLTPDGSDGTVEDVLDVNGGDGTGSKDPDFISADVRFAPQNDTTFPKTQQILVEWDNRNESQNVTIKGIAGSTIDVLVPNDSDTDSSVTTTFSDGTASIDYGDVTENEKKDAKLVVKETSGERSFNITSDLSFNGGNTRYNISNNSITTNKTLQKDTTTPSVNADIAATPPEGSSGSGEVAFAHDADNIQEAHLGTPVTISLNMNVLNKAEVTLNDINTGGPPVKLVAEPGDTSSEIVRIVEIGGDNDANITGLTFTDDAGGVFSIKNNFTDVVQAGDFTDVDAPQFSPTTSTGSSPDFTVNGTLQVDYTGPGAANDASAQIGIEGEVIRPSKADFGSGVNKPLVIQGDPNAGGGRRGDGVYFEENLPMDGTVVTTQEYVVVEENQKNSYNITDITVNGPFQNNPYRNRPSGAGNTLSSPVTISAGSQDAGTIEFIPDSATSSGVFDSSQIEVTHDAAREGSKASDGPDNSTIALPIFAEIVAKPTDATWSGRPRQSNETFVPFEVIGLPENCQDIFVQASDAGGATFQFLSFGESGDNMFSNATGQRGEIRDDATGNFDFVVNYSLSSNPTTDSFDVKIYEVNPGENTSSYPLKESDGGSPNGTELISRNINLNDDGSIA